jgi:hypothetical protein
MNPIAIITGISTSVQLLKSAKKLLYPEKNSVDANDLLRIQLANDVGSLQEQVKACRRVADKLLEQAKADREMLERHNEVLIQIGEATQEALADISGICRLAKWALGFSVVAVAVAAVALILR